VPDRLPPLSTSAARIVDLSGRPVRLRGINLPGLEYGEPSDGSFLDAARISPRLVARIVREWGANVVRIPFNQAWALRGCGRLDAEAYLADLDRVIDWCAGLGAYAILDLQWIDARVAFGFDRDGRPNRVPPLPNPESVEVWRRLARRYRETSSVLFDVFNEPHDPVRDPLFPERSDPHVPRGIRADGSLFDLGTGRVTMEIWQDWARKLVEAVRGEHPAALIFVSGVEWAYDLRGMPLTVEPGGAVYPNVVYSSHVYPWRGGESRSENWRVMLGLEPTWAEAFGELAARAPVFVGEWGGGEADVDWGRRLRRYMDELEIGWAAWSWRDYPALVTKNGSSEQATPFGELVRDALGAAGREVT
jgi:hypothetical protein